MILNIISWQFGHGNISAAILTLPMFQNEEMNCISHRLSFRSSYILYVYTWKKVKEHPLFQINFHMDLNNDKAVDKTRNIVSSS